MKAVRLFLVALTALAVGFACDRSPTGVPQAREIGPSLFRASIGPAPGSIVIQCTKVPSAKVTQVIGPEGGTMNIGPHTLVIPAGALARSVKITAELPKTDARTIRVEPPKGPDPKKVVVGVNPVHFKPKLKFDTPAYLTMSYANCHVEGPESLDPTIVYTNRALTVILERLPSVANPAARTVSAWINHFSSYVVAW